MTNPAQAVKTAAAVVNLATQVFTLVKSGEVETMPQLASALPPGVDPNAAGHWTGWSMTPATMHGPIVYKFEWPWSDTKFELGVRFNYGGRADGQPWTYLKDVEAFVILDSTTGGTELDIQVNFASTGTPIDSQKTVMLTGSFNCRLIDTLPGGGPYFSQFYGIRVFGDGSGDIKRM